LTISEQFTRGLQIFKNRHVLAASGENIGETGTSGSSLEDLLRGAVAVLNMQIEVNTKQAELLALEAQTAANVTTIANLNADIATLDNDISTLNAEIAVLNSNITTETNKQTVIGNHAPYGGFVQNGVSGGNDLMDFEDLTAGTDQVRMTVTRTGGSGTLNVNDVEDGFTNLLGGVVNGTTAWIDVNQPIWEWKGNNIYRFGCAASTGTWTGDLTPEFKNTQTSATNTGVDITGYSDTA